MAEVEYLNAHYAGKYAGDQWVVRATDYEALQSELAALKAENERLRSEKAELLARLQSLGAVADRLVAALQQEQGPG